jgi:hypothetical protein
MPANSTATIVLQYWWYVAAFHDSHIICTLCVFMKYISMVARPAQTARHNAAR